MENNFCIQDSKNLLELCHDGVDEEVKSLLESKHKGAAVNATFEDVHVSSVCIYVSLILHLFVCVSERLPEAIPSDIKRSHSLLCCSWTLLLGSSVVLV